MPLEAGSIFMKNGYIIQGPIVERNDGAVVLGWNYGKLTIHRRFIDTVNYEAGEEKKLQEEEGVRTQRGNPGAEEIPLLAATQDSDELPPTLEALVSKIGGIKGLVQPAGQDARPIPRPRALPVRIPPRSPRSLSPATTTCSGRESRTRPSASRFGRRRAG
jgi:hypothetical protein